MKFTYNWLKDYLKTDKTPKEIADKLSQIGLEVEELIDPTQNLKQFHTAEILEVKKHPEADKLNVLKVACGKETFNIVCGAPNVRAGLKSVLAVEGDTIPLYNEKLKKSKIRGIESQGMLCSEKELCLSDNHDGIIELPDSTKHGQLLIDVMQSDSIFNAEITSNRPDYLGVEGIARDLSACGYGKFETTSAPKLTAGSKPSVKINLAATEICPHFCAIEIRDLKNTASPEPIYSRLKAIGINPKSFLIDITNYFCIGKNRPMHAFDLDKLKGKLEIRFAVDSEKFTGLDDKEYVLSKEDCVLADENGVQLLSGIMGGKNSGCDEKTKNILLICETLEPISIRKTARRLKIESDSKYRFERGVDPFSDTPNLIEAAQMILKTCGGKNSELIELGKPYTENRKIAYDLSIFEKLIGMPIDKKTAEKILNDLGFKVAANFSITPPSFRQDIIAEHDITEELIRIYGYDKIVPQPLPRKEKVEGTLNTTQKNELKIKRILCAQGLYETSSWNFVDENLQKLFFDEDGVKIENPILSNLNVMQKTPLINLLTAVNYNQSKGNFDLPLFSVSPVFQSAAVGDQKMITAGIITGNSQEKTWENSNIKYTIFDMKKILMTLLKEFNLEKSVKAEQDDAPKFAHPNQFVKLTLGKFEIATFGAIHPLILKNFDIKGDVFFFTLNNELLPTKEKGKTKEALNLSEFQEVKRDFAFLADTDFKPAEFLSKVEKLDPLITKVLLFDNFKKDDKKSLAINITLSPTDKTLTQNDLESIHNKVVDLAKTFALTLRQ